MSRHRQQPGNLFGLVKLLQAVVEPEKKLTVAPQFFSKGCVCFGKNAATMPSKKMRQILRLEMGFYDKKRSYKQGCTNRRIGPRF